MSIVIDGENCTKYIHGWLNGEIFRKFNTEEECEGANAIAHSFGIIINNEKWDEQKSLS